MSTSSGTPEPPEHPEAEHSTEAPEQEDPSRAVTSPEPPQHDAEDPGEDNAEDPGAGPSAARQPANADTQQPPDTPAGNRAGAGPEAAGPPSSPGPEEAGPGADKAGADAPGPPRPRRRLRRILVAVACTLALVLALAGGGVWWAYHKLNGNIHTDPVTARILHDEEADRPPRNVDPQEQNAENILLIGSDDRSGANAEYGKSGGQRSDTTILLHLAADRRSAAAVSIPRDAMVNVPSCERPDGSHTAPQFEQFNWAFEFGGASCTIRTVEDLTHIRVDHDLVIDFTGFKKMVDAVDGVDVCLPEAVHDQDSKLNLTAGRHKLNGEQALGFVRARESIGDGSDTERMGRQQQFLSSLVKKVQTDGVLFNPTKLWPLLNSATSAITADPGLDSLSALYDLAESVRAMPPDNVAFLTAPREPYPPDPNRDQLVQPQADMLFKALKQDQPVHVVSATAGQGGSASASPSGSALTFTGRTASQDICDSQ